MVVYNNKTIVIFYAHSKLTMLQAIRIFCESLNLNWLLNSVKSRMIGLFNIIWNERPSLIFPIWNRRRRKECSRLLPGWCLPIRMLIAWSMTIFRLCTLRKNSYSYTPTHISGLLLSIYKYTPLTLSADRPICHLKYFYLLFNNLCWLICTLSKSNQKRYLRCLFRID